MIPSVYKYLAIVIAVLSLVVAAKLYVSHLESAAYDRGRAELQAEMDAQSLKTALAYAERIKTAQEERDAKQAAVDKLSADVRRLRIHQPSCPAIGPTTATSEDKDGGARAFSERVDEAFAELQRETTSLIERCDALNLDAIEANAIP